MSKRDITIFTAISAIIFTGFYLWISGKLLNPTALVKISDTVIQAELADTPEKRVQGLSGREKLGENEGMLFIFDESDYHGIWMKGMRFPIDIIWARPVRDRARADAPEGPLGRAISNGVKLDLEIVDIAENISPDTYPQVFRPKESAFYVLEVNADFVAKNGIKTGDAIEFER